MSSGQVSEPEEIPSPDDLKLTPEEEAQKRKEVKAFLTNLQLGEGDPLPWIDAAKPTYPTLIDREHRLAELYGIVNVPQAVWIDEAGRIVRPAEPAGAYEGFRQMNRSTRELPEDVARRTAQAKAIYLDAIRDWARNGEGSAYASTW